MTDVLNDLIAENKSSGGDKLEVSVHEDSGKRIDPVYSSVDLNKSEPKVEVPVEVEEEVIKEEVVETPVEVVTSKTVEEKARESGWAPKDQWNGDPDEWVDAKEYVARGSFFKKIAKQKQEIESQKQVLEEVLKTLSQSEERSYKKALKDIENGKLYAKHNKDIDTYEKYIQQEQKLAEEYNAKSIKAVREQQEQVNVFETSEFKNYALTDPYILKKDVETEFARVTAQRLSNEYATANPGSKDIAGELKYIQVNMRRIHPPERFPELYRSTEVDVPVTPKVVTTSRVGGVSSRPSASSDVSFTGLSDLEKRVATKLKNDGLDWKSYVKEVKLK